MSPFSPVLSSEPLCSASFFPEPCLPSSCPIYFSTCKVSIKNSGSYSSFRFFKIKTHMINLCLVNATHFLLQDLDVLCISILWLKRRKSFWVRKWWKRKGKGKGKGKKKKGKERRSEEKKGKKRKRGVTIGLCSVTFETRPLPWLNSYNFFDFQPLFFFIVSAN